MNLKGQINSILRKWGYEVNRYKKPYESEDFSLQSIFAFFPKWVTRFELNGETLGGQADYSSQRVSVLNHPELAEFINVSGKSVIEFGPLECGNTILLEKMGAQEIVSVEGHLENFIRSCVIKNLFELNKTKLVYNDAMAINEVHGSFDIALVAGLLYHLNRPDIFLKNLGKFSSSLILSTHLAGPKSPSESAPEMIVGQSDHPYHGKKYKEYSGPNSGLASYSFWPYKDELLRMIRDAGFRNIRIFKESIDPNGYELIYLGAIKDPNS